MGSQLWRKLPTCAAAWTTQSTFFFFFFFFRPFSFHRFYIVSCGFGKGGGAPARLQLTQLRHVYPRWTKWMGALHELKGFALIACQKRHRPSSEVSPTENFVYCLPGSWSMRY